MKKNTLALFFLLVALFFLFFYPSKKDAPYTHNEGRVFGTFYSLTYQHPEGEDLHQEVISALQQLDTSLSIFNDSSVIALINSNQSTQTDELFRQMFQQAQAVSEATHGAFDITVAPLVDLWGFGRGTRKQVTQAEVDSIRQWVGFHKLDLQNNLLIKSHPQIRLDASAIAKGLGVDVALKCLQAKGCINAMVEIGGEVACCGLNPNGEAWKVGINKPVNDTTGTDKSLERILHLTNMAVATSGNYRQFYYQDGKKYAHTIDPRTGYPASHSLLSATVIAPSCMEADAWATAFMVLGVDSALNICESQPELDCFLIYENEQGEIASLQSSEFTCRTN